MQQPSDRNPLSGYHQPTNRATRRAIRRKRQPIIYAGAFPVCRQPHASSALAPIHMTVFRAGAPVALPAETEGPFASVAGDAASGRESWHMLVNARTANRAEINRGQEGGIWSINDNDSPRRLCWMLDAQTFTAGIPRVLQSFRGAEMSPASLHLLVTDDDAEQREELVAMLELGARQAPAGEAASLAANAPEAASEILRRLPHLVSIVHETDEPQVMFTWLRAAAIARAALESDGGRLASARDVLRRVREVGEQPLPPAEFRISG